MSSLCHDATDISMLTSFRRSAANGGDSHARDVAYAIEKGGRHRAVGEQAPAGAEAVRTSSQRAKHAAEPRSQLAALPFRKENGVEVMLVSSRGTRRWVLPKGWPMKGRKPYEAAAVEALEEAGLIGAVDKLPIGTYHYLKRMKNGASVPCKVDVYPMHVTRQRKNWPARRQRVTRWFNLDEASQAVDESELQELIRNFEPQG
jgi:8-oxo-dGTP pyrophosphatase MutT (NUDIX family)